MSKSDKLYTKALVALGDAEAAQAHLKESFDDNHNTFWSQRVLAHCALANAYLKAAEREAAQEARQDQVEVLTFGTDEVVAQFPDEDEDEGILPEQDYSLTEPELRSALARLRARMGR
ncbi:hypothetical protein SEA_HELPFUL_75 [Mycobacterium phage Helpful]|uniref:Uncharacterized protein n=1 Tax=Mycobacterium phage Helpful TaxID=2652420 RepID=A0A5P8DAJ2_9CAUD|nr:hypothetical protein SEA_HELPFUL_75 [Mycobacterium phage Helpful]